MRLHGIKEIMYNLELRYMLLKFYFNILLLCTILDELTQLQNKIQEKIFFCFFVGFFCEKLRYLTLRLQGKEPSMFIFWAA